MWFSKQYVFSQNFEPRFSYDIANIVDVTSHLAWQQSWKCKQKEVSLNHFPDARCYIQS